MNNNPIFDHDFNQYNKQVIKLNSKQISIRRLITSTVVVILCVACFFIFNISNSSATQDIGSNQPNSVLSDLDSNDTTVKGAVLEGSNIELTHEELVLPNVDQKQHILELPPVTQKPTNIKSINSVSAIANSTATIQTVVKHPNEKFQHIRYTIRSGDNLASIFKKYHLSKQLLHNLIYSTDHGKQLARIKPGQEITMVINDAKKLQQISLYKSKIETLVISLASRAVDDKKILADKYTSTIEIKEIEKRQRFVSVTIDDSLFLSATKAGLSESFTMELAHLFGWDIDFALEIRKGDSFSVLFNEQFVNGKKIANGQILAAEFTNQGKIYQTIYFTDESGKSDYYSVDGFSKRRAFLRTPVAFSRISSYFSKNRKHPILNRIRAHKGVDYAAPRGTPIKSSGDGKVTFKGRKGGYGNVVQIQHGSKYATVYAHMSSFNKKIKRGSKVKQGQVIGYVGSTGRATGPHLHYEFRVNGVHRNPLTVELPRANPINKKHLKNFLEHSENMISSLKLKKHEQIALFKQK